MQEEGTAEQTNCRCNSWRDFFWACGSAYLCEKKPTVKLGLNDQWIASPPTTSRLNEDLKREQA
jgi:hypothetical protein